MSLQTQCVQAQKAARILARLSTTQKNQALLAIANHIRKNKETILKANEKDIKNGQKAKLSDALRDRLKLTNERLERMACDIENVAQLPDSVGQILEDRTLPNKLNLQRIRCPIGVVAVIYESRPNVTTDVVVLALKSGNSIILKGGSEAINSNRALVSVIKSALKSTAIPVEAVQFIDSTDRAMLKKLLALKNMIDVIIPRGGQGLIDFVVDNSRIPVIETGASVVHTYIDEETDLKKAVEIVINEKTRRPSVCNAVDVILVHKKIASVFLPKLSVELGKWHVQIRADQMAYKILKPFYENLKKATKTDYDTEFLDYILAIKIVKNLDEALEHIFAHGLKHSESIVTENKMNQERFLREVDAACVYANTSTCFSDGAQFGLGAEIGISTQKLHARGPFALEGLTSYKWIVRGDGQVRS